MLPKLKNTLVTQRKTLVFFTAFPLKFFTRSNVGVTDLRKQLVNCPKTTI